MILAEEHPMAANSGVPDFSSMEIIDMEESMARRISQAKLKIMMRPKTTFFSALLSKQKIYVTTAVPTAGTNGHCIWFNPDFVEKQSLAKLIGLMLHEVMHMVYDHFERVGNRDKVLYNIAGDHAINTYLVDQGFEIPEGGHCNFKYRNWSTNKIYEDLLQDPPPNYQQQMGDIAFDPPEGMSEEEHRERLISNVVEAVQQAEMAGDPGSVPGFVKKRLKPYLNPELPWHTLLAQHMVPYAREDYSWSRPNRRFLPDIYLPHVKSEQLKQITASYDVSGSMSQAQLNRCHTEVNYIWETLKPKSMRITSFDTCVHDDFVVDEGEDLGDIELAGGGGTDVTPIIEQAKKDQPEVLLIFTDGYFGMPDLDDLDGVDLIWIIEGHPDFEAPYGTVIHFNE